MTAYTDFHYSPTGSGVISGVQVLEQTEQGINGLGQYVQDNVSGAIDTANQALTIAQTADSNATLALNTANSFASAISAANNTANNALTTAQSAQNTANTASSLATTANNNANTALNAANTATSNVATLTSSVNALGNRMTTAENAISTNAGNITTLQTNLQTTNNNVTAAANAASSAQATATSAQSTATLARNQAYVLRYTGTTITGGGTIAYADIDNTDNIKAGDKIIDVTGAIYAIASVDTANQTVTVGASPVINLFCDAENLIPAATDTYDLGSSSYQWNNLYAKQYYYNSVAWGLDKANTWTGDNTYTTVISYQTSYTLGNPPQSSQAQQVIRAIDIAGTNYLAQIATYQDPAATGLRFAIRDKFDSNGFSPSGSNRNKYFSFLQNISNQGYFKWDGYIDNSISPLADNTYNLGTSTNKWATLNGINPGALSLPNGTDNDTSWIGDLTILDGSNNNEKTFLKDGWVSINIPGTAGNFILVNNGQGQIVSNVGTGVQVNCAVIFPVRANVRVYIIIKIQTGEQVKHAIWTGCAGNV